MKRILPKPEEVGIKPPAGLDPEVFQKGFDHAVAGGQLTEIEQFRRSFSEGFRAGKLFLREERRRRGIIDFPFKGRIKFKAT